MTLTSGLAVYFIIWWLVLFAILPFGSHSAYELGEETNPGEAPSAPKNPRILFKFAITTVIAAVVFAAVYALLTSGIISSDDFPYADILKPYS